MINGQGHGAAARIVLSATLCFILGAFIFSLFKNIQYPLLWNDESETAMYAKRISQYGYPKIHDGKNIVWLTELPDKEIGVDKKRDSPSSLVWGQYYFASIGEFFAEKADDIYLKTAFLRIPFATAGLIGLFIMALSIINLFEKNIIRKLTFLIIFFSFALSSVTLTLHLREVRHPALVVLLSACIFYIYFNYRYYNKLRTTQYFIGLTLFLFLLYHVFHIVCFIFFAVIGLYELIMLLREKNVRLFLSAIVPVFVAFLLVVPFFIFSQAFETGRASMGAFYTPPWIIQFSRVLHFFQRYELLYLILAVKMVFFCVLAYFSKEQLVPEPAVKQKMQVSNFLSLFFIVYISTISRFPCFFVCLYASLSLSVCLFHFQEPKCLLNDNSAFFLSVCQPESVCLPVSVFFC